MEVRRDAKGNIFYLYQGDQKTGAKAFAAWEIIHFRGLSSNGVLGMSPLQVAKEVLGSAISTQDYGSTFWANGARPGGVIEVANEMGEEAYNRLRLDWQNLHGGPENANRVAILEGGALYKPVYISNTDAQFIENKKFQRSEICGIFRVPPHMIGDLERSTYSNIEQQSLDFVQHSLRPWLVRIEQAVNTHPYLIGDSERGDIYAEHSVEGLLRGDSQGRADFYTKLWNLGALSPNEIRAYENLNPVPGGDIYMAPLYMTEVDEEGLQPPASMKVQQDDSADDEAERAKTALAFWPLFHEAWARTFRRIKNEYTPLVRKAATPEAWAVKRAELIAFAHEQLDPVVKAYRAAGGTCEDPSEFIERETAHPDPPTEEWVTEISECVLDNARALTILTMGGGRTNGQQA
jgi:HK97 family phage portal protein